MPIPTRQSPLFTRISILFQRVTEDEPYTLARATLTAIFNAPVTFCRILINLATQPLPKHERHIRPTSNPAALPGYWIAPNAASVNLFQKWEVDNDDFDILLVYCHGGAFSVGHSLMYSPFFYKIIGNPKLRVRIYTIEYKLPLSTKYSSRFPYQHHRLFTAYRKLLEMNIPASKIIIGGDGSGGFNVLKCFERIIEDGVAVPAGILLYSPLVNLWLPKSREEEIAELGFYNSLDTNRHNDFLSLRFLRNGLRLYKPPLYSAPVRKGAKWYGRHLPPTFLAYGTGEVLLDGIREFDKGLGREKVELTRCIGKGEPHCWSIMEAKCSKDKDAWAEASEELVEWMDGFVHEKS